MFSSQQLFDRRRLAFAPNTKQKKIAIPPDTCAFNEKPRREFKAAIFEILDREVAMEEARPVSSFPRQRSFIFEGFAHGAGSKGAPPPVCGALCLCFRGGSGFICPSFYPRFEIARPRVVSGFLFQSKKRPSCLLDCMQWGGGSDPESKPTETGRVMHAAAVLQASP